MWRHAYLRIFCEKHCNLWKLKSTWKFEILNEFLKIILMLKKMISFSIILTEHVQTCIFHCFLIYHRWEISGFFVWLEALFRDTSIKVDEATCLVSAHSRERICTWYCSVQSKNKCIVSWQSNQVHQGIRKQCYNKRQGMIPYWKERTFLYTVEILIDYWFRSRQKVITWQSQWWCQGRKI